jgi:Fe-S oxidoreductase
VGLEDIKKVLKHCAVCGLCFGPGPIFPFREEGLIPEKEGIASHECPIYKRFKFASYSPRGLLWLAAATVYRGLPVSDELAQRVYTCLTCGVCDDVCYINKCQTIQHLREEIVERRVGPPNANQVIDDKIKRTNNYFGYRNKDRTKWAKDLPLSLQGDILYFVGCFDSFIYPYVPRLVVKILNKAGIKVAYLDEKEICCACHSFWDGNTALIRQRGKALLNSIEKTNIKEVLVSCADCYRTFREEYDVLFGAVPFKVIHISEYLATLQKEGKLKFVKEIRKKVGYHDPCRLFNHFLIGDEPRKLIKSIPGIEFIEVREGERWTQCCGSGGLVVENAFPEFTHWVAERKLRASKEVIDSLITGCPHCFHIFSMTATKINMNTTIHHLAAVIAESMGITP